VARSWRRWHLVQSATSRDHLYVIYDHGLLTCFDARTGAVIYEGARPPQPGDYLSSPVAFHGSIFLTNTDGETAVLRADSSHQVVRTNSLGEPVYASFALAGASIFIRAEHHLYRISTQPGHPRTSPAP